MRVLYSFPHTLGAPGIGTTALQHVRALVRAGADVTVLCTTSSASTGAREVVETMRFAGRRVPHRVFGTVQRGYDHHDRVTSRWLRRRQSDVDVVHVWPRSCLRTLRTAREVGLPTAREVPSPHTQSAFERAAAAADEFGLAMPAGHSHHWDTPVLARENAEYEAADRLLVPSDYAAGTFVERGFAPEHLARTRYGVDLETFGPARRPTGRPLQAVFVGRGEPNKGLHVALRAWAASAAAQHGRFVIAGRMWAPYGEQLADLLSGPGVEVRGFVSDVPALLAAADVLLLPSYTEGSALVTYEALATGCVPLVSTATGAPVAHGVNGLVHDVGDSETLRRQLDDLATSPDHLQALQEAALAARQDVSWDEAAHLLLAAYEHLVGAGGSGVQPREQP